MATFWAVCRWVGLGVLVIVVISMLVGSGFCAGAQRQIDRNTFVQSGRSVADIHVDAAPGADVDASVHIGNRRPVGQPAWMRDYDSCRAHFINWLGQAPAGRCDHLPGASAKADPAPRPRPQPVVPARRAPCPPCDVK